MVRRGAAMSSNLHSRRCAVSRLLRVVLLHWGRPVLRVQGRRCVLCVGCAPRRCGRRSAGATAFGAGTARVGRAVGGEASAARL